MNYSRKPLGLIFLAVLFTACTQPQSLQGEKPKLTASDKGQLAPLMQSFKSDLQALIPYLYSQKGFSDPANEKTVLTHLQNLNDKADDVHRIKSTGIAARDPSLQFAADELKTNLHLSYSSFKEGHKPFAQGALRDSVQQCFYCHSRNASGPQLGYDSLDNKMTKGMTATDKADYLVAVREFDAARKALLDYFKKSSGEKSNPIEIETTAKKWLALEIRVEDRPKNVERALKIIDQQKQKPENISVLVKDWKKSLAQWKKEKKPLQGIEGAESLLFGSLDWKKLEVRSDATDLDFIRATVLLHNYLENKKPAAPDKSRALLFLGMSYERLRDLGFWNLNEFYYESCIRTSPHSATAQACYSEWDDSIVSGFSGSSGTFIPASAQKKRGELKSLASPTQ